MRRRGFLGLFAAAMASPAEAVSVLKSTMPQKSAVIASTQSIHSFKMLLNDLGFRALLEPDNVVGDFEYALRNYQHADIESILAEAFKPSEEIAVNAMKLVHARPSVAGMTNVLNGLKRDDPGYYASLFADAEPNNLALQLDNQFANGERGVKTLLEEFDTRLKDATRTALYEIKRAYELETAPIMPSFADMAAARKAGGYPMPANYRELEKVTIGEHRTALGENTWIDRLSTPDKDASAQPQR
jgi:hypothetical protein